MRATAVTVRIATRQASPETVQIISNGGDIYVDLPVKRKTSQDRSLPYQHPTSLILRVPPVGS